MITPDYARAMARYNAEMNRRVYAAAARLADAERREARGAFWGSIHGTLSHLAWADQIWMSRFDGWAPPDVALKQSDRFIAAFDTLAAERTRIDDGILAWAERLDPAWLTQDLVWVNSTGRERRRRRDILVAHMFNHQTHHRGQLHCLLTQSGQDTGDTDLMILVQ